MSDRSIFDDRIMPSGSAQEAQMYKEYYDSRIAAAKNPNPVGVLAQLKRMATKSDPRYRIRRPVGEPKVGPRNTTKQDLIDFVDDRKPSQPVYERPPIQQYLLDPQQVYDEFVGGPGPGFGLEFGGQRSQANQVYAIEGQARAAMEARALAQQQADFLGEQSYSQLEENLKAYGKGLAGKQLETNREILSTPLKDLAIQMGGGGSNPATSNMDNAMYGANMARINAARGRGDFEEDQMESNAIAMISDLAQRQYDIGMAESGASNYKQIADAIGQLPYHEYARQIAVNRDGMDPALAAGLFGPDMDVEYSKDVTNAELVNAGMPQLTTDQFIYKYMGEDAYFQYMTNKAEKLVYGTPEELEQAEQDALDLANDVIISNAFGFSPMDVRGVDPAATRAAFQNEAFQGLVDQGLTTMLDENEMSKFGTGQDLGNALANQWLAQGGTPTEAQVLRQIFVTFDFSLG